MKNIINKKTKLLNIKEPQQHPFHVLTSSKLPILIATSSGGINAFISYTHKFGIFGIKILMNCVFKKKQLCIPYINGKIDHCSRLNNM